MSREKKDPYQVLGVSREATASEIKKAFRRIIRKNHPDQNPGDKEAEERCKEAAEAYDILSDEDKRARFDRFGHAGVGAGGGADFGSFGDIFSAFSDLFGGDIFGGARGRGRRGASYRTLLEIDFMDSALGCTKTITVNRNETCDDCDGSGAKAGSSPVTCTDCRGTGQRVISQGFFQIRQPCPRCGGEGAMIADPCKKCHGQGQVAKEVDVEVDIPAGIDNDMQIQVSGQGDHGTHGGPPGDLLVVIRVKPHEFFRRENNDLILELPVTFAQATLGTELEIPTLTGKEKIKIKAGTPVGHEIVLSGKGFPDPTGRYKHGDYRVVITIAVPKKLSARQEELLREFAEIEEKNVSPQRKSFFDSFKALFE